MKPVSILVPLLASGWVAGCNSSEPAPDDEPGDIITISIDKAPALVAFREAPGGAWQAARMTAPTTFEAEVHVPYAVVVVCEDTARNEVFTRQVARALDDDRTVMVRCDFPPPPRHAVTGRMIQAGRIHIGDGFDASTTADWNFSTGVRSGTFDVMAKTADQIVLRRGLSIAGPTALTPPIDVAQEGTPLVDVAFTATNAMPGETLVASVHLDQDFPSIPYGIYLGPIATAKVVPDSALVATDRQSVSIQARTGNELRALRRPFRVGGDTAYTLPDPIGGVQWTQVDGDLAMSWSSVPPFDGFSVRVDGTSTGGMKLVIYDVTLSPRFVEATGTTRVTLDTAIAGYKPEWKLDFAREHSRRLFVQRVVDRVITSSSIDETVNAGALAPPAPSLPLAQLGLADP